MTLLQQEGGLSPEPACHPHQARASPPAWLSWPQLSSQPLPTSHGGGGGCTASAPGRRTGTAIGRSCPPPPNSGQCLHGVSGVHVHALLLRGSSLEIHAHSLMRLPLTDPFSGPRRAEDSAAPLGTDTERLLAAEMRFTVYYPRDPEQTQIRPWPRGGERSPQHSHRLWPREDRLCQGSGGTGIPDRHSQAPSALLSTNVSTYSRCSTTPSLKHPLLPAHSSAPVCSCPPSRPSRALPPSLRATGTLLCWPWQGTESLKQKTELTRGAEHPGLTPLPGPVGRWSRRLPPLPLQSWSGQEGQERQSCQPRLTPPRLVWSLPLPAFPLQCLQHPLHLHSLEKQRAETLAPRKGNGGPI